MLLMGRVFRAGNGTKPHQLRRWCFESVVGLVVGCAIGSAAWALQAGVDEMSAASNAKTGPQVNQVSQNQGQRLKVLLEDPTCPSGGSGVICSPGDQTAIWRELDDYVPGGPLPPLVMSGGPALQRPGDEEPPSLRGTPGPVMSFNGVAGVTFPLPPDTHLAVGTGLGAAGRIIMVTNSSVQIWNKTGAVVAGPTLLTTFFVAGAFDPVVLFDPHIAGGGRFFIVALVGTTPATSTIHIARSTTATPGTLGAADWTFASGASGLVIGGTPTWADYPKIGADVSALFVTTNQFSAAPVFTGSNIRIYDKTTLGFIDVTYSAALTPGIFTICPAHVRDGTTSLGHFYLINRIGAGSYRLHWVTGHAPGAPPPTVITATFGWATGGMPGADFFADQGGTAIDIDTLATRMQNAVWRNGSLYGTLTSDPDADFETEVVWQQIPLNGDPAVTPPGVPTGGFINAGAATGWTYMPSIAVDNNDNVALVFTESDPALFANVSYALREPALDPPGTFGPTFVGFAGPGFYDSPYTPVAPLVPLTERWGDYSAVVSDPSEDCFWATNEYAFSSVVAGSMWGTRILKFCTSTTGACCLRANICANLPPGPIPGPSNDCTDLPGATFQGLGSSCPTMGVIPGMHSGVTTVHWAAGAVNCFSITPRPALGDGEIGDVAGGPSDCCQPHPSPGCEDPQCQQQVCGQGVCVGGIRNGLPCLSPPDCPGGVCQGAGGGLPHCCQVQWDAACAQQAQEVCEVCQAGPEECQEGLKIDSIATSDDPDQETSTDLEVPFGGFFGPGSDPFQGTVRFSGDPLGDTQPYGFFDTADTIIDRFNVDPDRCAIPGYEIDIPIEIVALNLVSIDPITVTYNGGQNPQTWNVRVNLTDFPPGSPMGTMTVTKTHCNGGTFTATFGVQAKFTFTEVGNPGNVKVLDTGEVPLPPDMLTVDLMPWVSDPDPNFHFDSPWCTDFHPGVQDPNQDTDCDCNNNLQYDRCDIEQGISLDCNRNGKPDECDPNLDLDGIPYECDNCPEVANAAQTDTDGDTVGDACDLCPLIGLIDRDQDGDRVENNVDNCPCIANPGQEDSNGNGCGDVCEPCAGLDPPKVADDTCFNGNTNLGTPCSSNAECTLPAVCGLKSRYLAITLNASPDPRKIKVTIVSMPQFPARVGEMWWAGPEVAVPNPPSLTPLRGAQLVCTKPAAAVWATGVVYLFGTAIVPNATYNVQICNADNTDCSDPLLVGTSIWGNVVSPHNAANFADISADVDKFRNLATAPITPRTDLVGTGNPGQPSTPNQVTNFADISAAVDAFRTFPYGFTVPACP